jgi:7-keto-8-aminopelargonate synthetase-like enzyme
MALGVVGGGRGSAFAHGAGRRAFAMGTLSKAGAYGGYLCASAPVIGLIRNRAHIRSFNRPATRDRRGRHRGP